MLAAAIIFTESMRFATEIGGPDKKASIWSITVGRDSLARSNFTTEIQLSSNGEHIANECDLRFRQSQRGRAHYDQHCRILLERGHFGGCFP